MQPLAYIPSPEHNVWHLGPFPLRAYALMIILGIVAAVWLGERRWVAKGGRPGVIIDVAVWAVPFGLVGGRLYHVITDYQRYFGSGGDPLRALEIWKGGLGVWGAIMLGAVGAVIGCRRQGISALALADAVAPGIALAQAIGRWGNYWNQELYGRPLHAWWAVEIDPDHRELRYADVATYHPTFLYESLWCLGVTVLVIWAGRRWNLTHGRSFALYVAAYTVGRGWVEALRVDDAHHILGLRLNDWTSIVIFLGAVAYLYLARNRTGVENVGAEPVEDGAGDGPAEDGPAKVDLAKDESPKDEPDASDEGEPAKDAEPAEPATKDAEQDEPEAGTRDDEPADEPVRAADAGTSERVKDAP